MESNKSTGSVTDILIILVRWRKFIILNTGIITVATLIGLLLMDNWYASTVSIIPPRKKGLFGDMGTISTKLKDLTKTLGRFNTSSDEAIDYLTVLTSRTASERVIEKFNLRSVYKFKADAPIEKIIDELASNVKMTVEEQGNITIKVYDKDKIRAAAMANFYVEILNEISLNLNTFEARNNREFVEKRYFQVLDDLKTAEEQLRTYGKSTKAVLLDEQVKGSIQEVVELKTSLMFKEIEYNSLKTTLGETHPATKQIAEVITTIKRQLEDLLNGGTKDPFNAYNIPFSKITDVGIEKLRLMRTFEIQTRLLEFVLPIYEQAKIDEKKDLPVCLVLDKAVPAQQKAYPKRAIITLIVFSITLLLSAFIAMLLQRYDGIKQNPDAYAKINQGILIPLKSMFSLRRK